MKIRVIALYGVAAMASFVPALAAHAQTAPTSLEGGSVLVYSLSDNAPPAAARMASMPASAPVYTQPTVDTYNVAAPMQQPVPAAYSAPYANTGSTDTSYGSSGFYIVGANQPAAPAYAPASAPILTVTDPVMPVVPQADGSSIQQPIIADMAPPQQQSMPIPELTAASPAPVAPAPVPVAEPAPVMAAVPVAPVPSTAYSAAPAMASMGDSCAINQSLVEKITLLEREKENLRMGGASGPTGEMQRIAQCAPEHTKIQTLEAELDYLRQENESLKRITSQPVAVPLPAQAPDAMKPDMTEGAQS